MEKALRKIYLDPRDPGGLGGESTLFKRARQLGLKATKKQVREFLKSQDPYTLHKKRRRRFKRSVTYVPRIDIQWQADLSDLSKLEKYNDGTRFLLFAIDVFSRYAFVRPLKNKTGKVMVQELKTIFKERKPKRLQTDRGSEFYNKTVKEYLDKEGIHLFSTENYDIKAAIVERLQRTIKEKMYRYFTANNTVRYVDVLQDLVDAYNSSVHRGTKMAPKDVNPCNSYLLYETLYKKGPKRPPAKKFKKGDYVRISKYKTTFAKGYESNWSREVFLVDRIISKSYPYTYSLKDLKGEQIKGRFYEPELQDVKFDPEAEFLIEDIIKERGRGRNKEVLVRWKGYPESFDQWIPANTLTKL